MTVMSPVSAPPLTIQPSQPTAVPPNAHPIPVPIINVYTQQPEPMRWKRQLVQRGQREIGKPYTGPPGMSWGCKQYGHNKIDCPTMSWQQPTGGETGESWQQPTRGPSQGPVNPWGGPNQGY